MTFSDTVQSVPGVSKTIEISKSVFDCCKNVFKYGQEVKLEKVPVPTISMNDQVKVAKLALREMRTPFIRLAGLSGATAVVLGAYGAHAIHAKEMSEDQRTIFETASRYHFMHTLALLGVPLTRRPALVGSLFSIGMILFCGTCYYHSLSGDPRLRSLTPFGGVFLICGWLAMVL